ncbi:MAG: hypothetical protein CVV21_07095 [Candidatus Goldiibacteriota bacterium HGW-Goldbacteria-1]|nr:MAG: hypothetical protein CVV21_07095 [Candidatus Goldiibacteriota bacterium HGW-Goldbacteria-1]
MALNAIPPSLLETYECSPPAHSTSSANAPHICPPPVSVTDKAIEFAPALFIHATGTLMHTGSEVESQFT